MERNISAVEIMQFMTNNSLRLYKKKGSNSPLNKVVDYEKAEKMNPHKRGIVFVSSSKNDLTEGKGLVVSSYETLHEKRNELTHWTPNIFCGGTYYDFKNRIIKGHKRENLKQINTISFDIDTKEIDLYALFLGCDELGLPRPNVLLSTPRGFQGFFVLETPFFITKNKDFKALRVAERLTENVIKALKKYVPVDMNCVPFGFYRIPQDSNVVYFDDKPANTNLLLSWSKDFEAAEKRSAFHVVYSKNASAFDHVSSDWYYSLIRATNIKSGYHASSRNNALLTLAIANYASGKPLEEAYDELDLFNSNLEKPLSKNEFERTLRSAYSGKYKGPKRSYVEGLLELWTDGSVKFQGKEGWYKFKKPREKRVRSHYEERESDILAYLEDHTSPENPFLEGSLAMLSEIFGMAVSTLKEVLKRSTKLIKRTLGRGRNSVSMIANRSILFRSLLQKRNEKVRQAQMTFSQLLPKSDQVIGIFDFPDIVEELSIHELEFLQGSGVSPPTSRTG